MSSALSRPSMATPKSVASPRSGHSRIACRCSVLAMAGLASAGTLAVPITEFHAYRIDPDLGSSFVNSIASNDLMTGEDSTNHGFVMQRRKPAQGYSYILCPTPHCR
jgi:hypothetical protein